MQQNSTISTDTEDKEPKCADNMIEISADTASEPACEAINEDSIVTDKAEADSLSRTETKQDDTFGRFYKLIKDFFSLPNTEAPGSPIAEQDKPDFNTLFPGVDREQVENDPDFALFRKAKSSDRDISDLYKDFLELSASIERKVTEKLLAKSATSKSSVGSLSSNERIDGDYFTKEQVLKMSEAQIRRNFDKIRQSQTRW